ncbi:Tk family protein [Megaselia abdita]
MQRYSKLKYFLMLTLLINSSSTASIPLISKDSGHLRQRQDLDKNDSDNSYRSYYTNREDADGVLNQDNSKLSSEQLFNSNMVNHWKNILLSDLLTKDELDPLLLMKIRDRRDFEYADYSLSAEEPQFFETGFQNKRAPKGFMGMRGKKANNGFYGVRGKKDLYNLQLKDEAGNSNKFGKEILRKVFSMVENNTRFPRLGLNYDEYIAKRVPSGFMGMRGRRAINGFYGVRGKRDISESSNEQQKRSAFTKYVGIRGKKLLFISPPSPYSDIFDTRGKKEPQLNYNFRNKFVGVRGKKKFTSTESPSIPIKGQVKQTLEK